MMRSSSIDKRPLRIAQIAPLCESVPPPRYGGTERVVSYLTEALVRQGHEVTLFASGDSVTSAKLAATCPRALRTDPNCQDTLAHHLVMLERVFADASRFDVMHFHIDYLHYPLSRRQSTPHVTTLHGRLDIADLKPIYEEYRGMPVISISDSQRKPLPGINWQGTVYHGLPADLYTFRERPGDYLAFLGRTSPEKGLEDAIEIARRAGKKLKIAAKVDKADRDYFRDHIEPLLRRGQSQIEFLNEVGGSEKDEFLGNALALLFPIKWPEPFGLVMIEAMACGTPVIAYRCASVPEIMEDGVTGFVVDGLQEAVEAVNRIAEVNRRGCRRVFEQRFLADRMAADYLAIYRRLVRDHQVETRNVIPFREFRKRGARGIAGAERAVDGLSR